MSNLRLINETEITSGVSTVNIEDVFSADFDIYKIVANDLSTVGTLQTDPDLRFINSTSSFIFSSLKSLLVKNCGETVPAPI